MAKQQFPGLKAGSGLLAKLIVGAVVLALLILRCGCALSCGTRRWTVSIRARSARSFPS